VLKNYFARRSDSFGLTVIARRCHLVEPPYGGAAIQNPGLRRYARNDDFWSFSATS